MQLLSGGGIGKDLRGILQLLGDFARSFEQFDARFQLRSLFREFTELRRLAQDGRVHELIRQLVKARYGGLPFLD
jgi:hypothetical protein